MKKVIRCACGVLLAAFVVMQVSSGTLPAEADEPTVVETVERADGSVASLEQTETQRTMTVTSPSGVETTTVEQADGSVVTMSREGARVRVAVSLSEEAAAHDAAPFVLPLSLSAEMREGRLSLDLPSEGQVTLALPLSEKQSDGTLWRIGRDGEKEPLAVQMQDQALVFTLASGQTAAFKLA